MGIFAQHTAVLPVPATNGLQVEARATHLPEAINSGRVWFGLAINLGAAGLAKLELYENGSAQWSVYSSYLPGAVVVLDEWEFQFSSSPVEQNGSIVVRLEWNGAGLFASVDGVQYLARTEYTMPEGAVTTQVAMGVGKFGGGGEHVVKVDYIDIASSGTSSAQQFWGAFERSYEIV